MANRLRASRGSRIVAWIGTYSYSIYLWRYDGGWLGYRLGVELATRTHLRGDAAFAIHTALWFLASIASGVVGAKLVEVLVMRLRERLVPAAPPSAPAATEGAAVAIA